MIWAHEIQIKLKNESNGGVPWLKPQKYLSFQLCDCVWGLNLLALQGLVCKHLSELLRWRFRVRLVAHKCSMNESITIFIIMCIFLGSLVTVQEAHAF